MGGCLVFFIGIGIGIVFGVLTDSVVLGIIVALIGTGFLCAVWNEAGATINQATQHQRDQKIIDELKKMNEDR